LNKMTDEQEADKIVWTPSKMIERLGREIDNEESIYYWCAKVCVCVRLSDIFRLSLLKGARSLSLSRAPTPFCFGHDKNFLLLP